jgi:hypothetical protein
MTLPNAPTSLAIVLAVLAAGGCGSSPAGSSPAAPAEGSACNAATHATYQPDSSPGILLPKGNPGQGIWNKMENSSPGISDAGIMTMLPPIGISTAHVRRGIVCPDGGVYLDGKKIASHVELITLTAAGGTLLPIMGSVNNPGRHYYTHPASDVIRQACPALIEYIPAPAQLGHRYDHIRAVILNNGDMVYTNNGA